MFIKSHLNLLNCARYLSFLCRETGPCHGDGLRQGRMVCFELRRSYGCDLRRGRPGVVNPKLSRNVPASTRWLNFVIAQRKWTAVGNRNDSGQEWREVPCKSVEKDEPAPDPVSSRTTKKEDDDDFLNNSSSPIDTHLASLADKYNRFEIQKMDAGPMMPFRAASTSHSRHGFVIC